jgi:hypothetical protein
MAQPVSRKVVLHQEKLRKEEKQKLELERLKGVMKARDKGERTHIQDDSRVPVMRVNLANSKTDIAYGYVKKDCVFRVTGEEGGQFLFQAIDKDDMLAWIKVINLATERASVIRHKSVLNEFEIDESDIPKAAPKREINGEHWLLFSSCLFCGDAYFRLLCYNLAKTIVYGMSLPLLAERDGILVPLIVEQCLTEVEKRGMTEEGIYRLSGAVSAINELRQAYDTSPEGVDLSLPQWKDINIVTGTLKLFFRELYDSVLPYESYQAFIDAVGKENLFIIICFGFLVHYRFSQSSHRGLQ